MIGLGSDEKIKNKCTCILHLYHSHACAHHNVHLGLEQPAEDIVREDDRHLADLQPAPPLHRSPRPHIHGQSQVTLSNQNIGRKVFFGNTFCLKKSALRALTKTRIETKEAGTTQKIHISRDHALMGLFFMECK